MVNRWTRFKEGSQEVDMLDCVHKLVLHLSVERTNLSRTTGQLTRNLVYIYGFNVQL